MHKKLSPHGYDFVLVEVFRLPPEARYYVLYSESDCEDFLKEEGLHSADPGPNAERAMFMTQRPLRFKEDREVEYYNDFYLHADSLEALLFTLSELIQLGWKPEF